MKLDDLEVAVRSHSGEFSCHQIRQEKNTKIVLFRHVAEPAIDSADLPEFGRLRDFYDTFNSVAFYHDEGSGESARYLASPEEWDELREGFNGWLDGLDEDEIAEVLPDWVENCIVIGEVPASGNYILMAAEGAESGKVFEFDHDGFEFSYQGNDVVQYAEKLLRLDSARLTDIASHMRFIESGSQAQWWIMELKDNRGHMVATED